MTGATSSAHKNGLSSVFISARVIFEPPLDTFDTLPYSTTQYTRFWITPRGKKLLEDQFADFWRFMIPTLISVAALAISAVSLIK